MKPTEDLKEYLGVRFKPIRGSLYIAEEWKKLKPKTPEEVKQAYMLVEGYMYDLSQWHETISREELTDELIKVLHNHNITEVLDFGAGICEDAIVLCRNGLNVSTTDLPSDHYAFGLWRLNKGNFPCKPIDIDKVWDSKYECIMLIDVLEHIVDIKEFIAHLGKATTYILERSPFGVHLKDKDHGDLYPMHTNYHRGFIYSLLEKEGFKCLEQFINDGTPVRLWKKDGNTKK